MVPSLAQSGKSESSQQGSSGKSQNGKNGAGKASSNGGQSSSNVSGEEPAADAGSSSVGGSSNNTGKGAGVSGSKATSSGSSSKSAGSSKSSGGNQAKSVSGSKSKSSASSAAATSGSKSSGGSKGKAGSGGSGKSSGSNGAAGASSNSSAGSSGAGGASGGGKGDPPEVNDAAEADDDSDRPAWAGGNTDANPHSGGGNEGSDSKKGDEYGDLYVVVRDPETGVPILVNGELQICTDEDCNDSELTIDGEVPADVTPIEVDFGRLNIGRAPTKVVNHALDEALSKITADDVELALDPAGRITVDGVTIDSPLENLALYIGIMTGDQGVVVPLETLGAPLSLAPALLGAAADKTGEITIDLVFYSNEIYDLVAAPATFYSYEGLDYDRTIYNTTVDYFYMNEGDVESGELNLMEYLEATQPDLTGAVGITLFSIAADDALEIVELVHTQIHDEELPGTVVP